MVCVKCGYHDPKHEVKRFDESLCTVCVTFAPSERHLFLKYIHEKIDWKVIDTFRSSGEHRGTKQKKGMKKRAKEGKIMTRAAYGYTIIDTRLVPNEESAKVHALFKEFLHKELSLQALSKKYGISVNGLKKILRNRTYLGEIKFDREFHKGNHTALIAPEIFYAVQRKLDLKLRPREKREKNNVVRKENNEEKHLPIESEKLFMSFVAEEPDEMYEEVFD